MVSNRSTPGRRISRGLPSVLALAALAALAACAPGGGGTVRPAEYAVYAEYSDSAKPMAPGANVRVFNRVEAQAGESLRMEEGTGVVTLKRGLYHVTASSIVTPYDPAVDTDGRVSPDPRPYGGYCRLRYLDQPDRDDPPIALGTISDANMLPSLIDTFLRVEGDEAKIVLDHQAGAHVDGLYLQVDVEGSSWHIFARIAIEKLE